MRMAAATSCPKLWPTAPKILMNIREDLPFLLNLIRTNITI